MSLFRKGKYQPAHLLFPGYSNISAMAVPMLPIQITVAIWLMVKGFKEGREPERDDAYAGALVGA